MIKKGIFNKCVTVVDQELEYKKIITILEYNIFLFKSYQGRTRGQGHSEYTKNQIHTQNILITFWGYKQTLFTIGFL